MKTREPSEIFDLRAACLPVGHTSADALETEREMTDHKWTEFYDLAISQGLTRAEATIWADEQLKPKVDPFRGVELATPLLFSADQLPRNFYRPQNA